MRKHLGLTNYPKITYIRRVELIYPYEYQLKFVYII